jgi:DoxX-like family
MFAAYLSVVITTFVVNAAAAAADFSRTRFVLANSAEVGVSEGWLPLFGALKAAGAVGLVIGLLWARPIGIAAAIGLVLFFIGAMATHVRAHVLYNLAFPGFYLALALGSLVLIAAR